MELLQLNFQIQLKLIQDLVQIVQVKEQLYRQI